MIRNEPRFVTPDDFENYWGENLNAKLKGDNYSNKANIFLKIVEDRLLNWIDANTFRVTTWDALTDYQLEQLQYAILTQAMYVFRNSDISLDSGYDPESGIIASKGVLNNLVVSQAALDFLKNAGLYNQRVTNRRRFTRFN